ncbi:bifunctional aminoglycoside phosphotransferase/ATP-binding protein [Actinokineospora bangkokensis]|uniref:Gluconate kinase n=1 Tax=Actinokineospora bangkokensis TaxID=1193682 RepID=A0A1Q9LQY4_9PSEU|nr:AAA family ATPase [Actinokineospora bangkokensis]OLR94456.1 gluconate kinase [Actinokineospora bangkokensis]
MRDQLDPIEVHETHSGVVFLVGNRAYKLKKPVDLGFLDFTDRAAREAACAREVELNRRLAPEVYLGVADVVDPDGRPCDHLVVMRRMPSDRAMSHLAVLGRLPTEAVTGFADDLAAFHARQARVARDPSPGGRDALLARWRESFEQTERFAGSLLDAGDHAELVRLTETYLACRGPLFADRVGLGRVIDGHGDLLAADVYCLDEGVRALDCLEFDDTLRTLDGLDDAASLTADLEALGDDASARAFLDSYVRAAHDPAPRSLRHHYVSYRAFVRAKVACLRHAQGDPDAASRARVHLAVALRHARAAEVRLVLVGGGPATGKSTVSAALGKRTGMPVLHSDEVRKTLVGMPPTAHAPAGYGHGIYTAELTDRTYASLLDRAAVLLTHGHSVVLDATWGASHHRAAAHTRAVSCGARVVALRCWAPEATLSTRLGAPRSHGSDAGTAVAHVLDRVANPWPQAHTVTTSGTVADSLAQAVDLVGDPG